MTQLLRELVTPRVISRNLVYDQLMAAVLAYANSPGVRGDRYPDDARRFFEMALVNHGELETAAYPPIQVYFSAEDRRQFHERMSEIMPQHMYRYILHLMEEAANHAAADMTGQQQIAHTLAGARVLSRYHQIAEHDAENDLRRQERDQQSPSEEMDEDSVEPEDAQVAGDEMDIAETGGEAVREDAAAPNAAGELAEPAMQQRAPISAIPVPVSRGQGLLGIQRQEVTEEEYDAHEVEMERLKAVGEVERLNKALVGLREEATATQEQIRVIEGHRLKSLRRAEKKPEPVRRPTELSPGNVQRQGVPPAGLKSQDAPARPSTTASKNLREIKSPAPIAAASTRERMGQGFGGKSATAQALDNQQSIIDLSGEEAVHQMSSKIPRKRVNAEPPASEGRLNTPRKRTSAEMDISQGTSKPPEVRKERFANFFGRNKN